jgi:hypothetical protein
MTEAQAKEKGIDVVVKKDPFGGNSRAQIIGDTEGVVKIVAEQRPDGSAGQILGVHMAGPWVTEQLGAGYLAVNWEALPEEVAYFIQPHPSLSESFGETMLASDRKGTARWLMSLMPQLGETVTEGTVTKWMKAVGDTVTRDEPLFEVSTDKVDSEVPSPAAGVLTEILVPEGETVEVGVRPGRSAATPVGGAGWPTESAPGPRRSRRLRRSAACTSRGPARTVTFNAGTRAGTRASATTRV